MSVLPSMLHPLVPLSDDQTVDSLILDDSRAWNVDMVQAIFPEDVAMKVLQVPISRHGGEDFAFMATHSIWSVYSTLWL